MTYQDRVGVASPATKRWLVARPRSGVGNWQAVDASLLSTAGFWQHPNSPDTWVAAIRADGGAQQAAVAKLRAAGLVVTEAALRRVSGTLPVRARVPATREASVRPIIRLDGSLLALWVEGIVSPPDRLRTVGELREIARRDGNELEGWSQLIVESLRRFTLRPVPATTRLWLPDWWPDHPSTGTTLIGLLRAARVPPKRVIVDLTVRAPGLEAFARRHLKAGVRTYLNSASPGDVVRQARQWDFLLVDSVSDGGATDSVRDALRADAPLGLRIGLAV